MKKLFLPSLGSIAFLLIPRQALAHCPLCTAGAGAAAAGAAVIGVKHVVIGLLIGAFAAALGFYLANRMKRQFIPLQKSLIVMSTFALTIIPLLPLLDSYFGFSIYLMGEYGSALNRVYVINRFLLGSILGGLVMVLIPYLSRAISKLQSDKRLPYQSLIITFTTLTILAILLQLVA